VSLASEKVGLFLQSQADELARIWRLARAGARPDVFPGLIDGLVAAFFLRAGELVATGAPPEAVWRGLIGLVRWPPSLAPAELSEEWSLMAEVVGAACESVNAAPEAVAWLARAAAAAEAGTAALAGGHGATPEGIVTAIVFSSVSPRQRAERTDQG
jgi:hypothetical protein